MPKRIIKNVISPLQSWLLSQGRCVACGTLLSLGKTFKHTKGTKVVCKCKRVYIKNSKDEYRRALLTEV